MVNAPIKTYKQFQTAISKYTAYVTLVIEWLKKNSDITGDHVINFDHVMRCYTRDISPVECAKLYKKLLEIKYID